MKVFIMSSVHKWNDTRIFYKEAKSLAKKHEVELHALAEFDFKEIDGVRIYGLPIYNKRYSRLNNWWRLFIRAVRSDAVVYHFHDPELIPLGLVLKLFNKKVIYDIHEDVPKQILSKYWIPIKYRKFISKAFNRFEKWASAKFDYNITVTENIKNNFKKSKMGVIKNYPLPLFSNNPNNYIKKDKLNVIYIGGINKNRGILEIIEATKLIKYPDRIDLKLAGPFYSNEYISKVEKSLNDHIHYLGNLSYDKVYDELLKSDIGIVCLKPIPNYVESLPIKLFEYMSCGLPIIASNFPLWKSIIENCNAGICVDPEKPSEIANALNLFLDNPNLIKEMGQNSFNAYKDKYNWKNEEQKLFNIYEKLGKNI